MTCTLRCFFLSTAALLVACDRAVLAEFVFSGQLELPSPASSGGGQSSPGMPSAPADAIAELAQSSSPVAESLSIPGLASTSTSLTTAKSSTKAQKASSKNSKTKTRKAKASTTTKPKKSKPAKPANNKKKKNKPGSGGSPPPPPPGSPGELPGVSDPLPQDDGSILPSAPGGPFDVDAPPLNVPPILVPEVVIDPHAGAPEDEFPPGLSSPPTRNPEPSTMLLLAVGGLCGAACRVVRARRAGGAATA